MKKDVMISLVGKQGDGGEQEKIELMTEGSYYSEDGNHFVTYNETEVTGMEGTTTTLKIEDGRITMTRLGQNNSQLIFERGQKHLCSYENDLGIFTIGINSGDVRADIGESEGVISAKYRIEFGGGFSGENDFLMKYRSLTDEH